MCEKLYGVWWRKLRYVYGKREENRENRNKNFMGDAFPGQYRVEEYIWHSVFWRYCQKQIMCIAQITGELDEKTVILEASRMLEAIRNSFKELECKQIG